MVTRRCNARCGMCHIWQDKHSPMLSVDEIRGIFAENDFAALRTVSLTGGEPTLRSDLPQVLEAVLAGAPNARELRLATNALLPKRLVQQVEKCWDVARPRGISRFTVQISLDGIGEIHDQVRGIEGAFERVQEALHQLVDLQQSISGLSLALSAVVQQANAAHIASLQNYAKDLRVPLYLSPIVTSLDYYANPDAVDALSVTDDQVPQDLFDRLARTAQGALGFHYQDVADMLRGRDRRRPCMMGYHAFVLEANGDVHPCVNCEQVMFGNLLKRSFRDIWWGKRARQLRQELHQGCCPSCTALCYLGFSNVGELIAAGMARLRGEASES